MHILNFVENNFSDIAKILVSVISILIGYTRPKTLKKGDKVFRDGSDSYRYKISFGIAIALWLIGVLAVMSVTFDFEDSIAIETFAITLIIICLVRVVMNRSFFEKLKVDEKENSNSNDTRKQAMKKVLKKVYLWRYKVNYVLHYKSTYNKKSMDCLWCCFIVSLVVLLLSIASVFVVDTEYEDKIKLMLILVSFFSLFWMPAFHRKACYYLFSSGNVIKLQVFVGDEHIEVEELIEKKNKLILYVKYEDRYLKKVMKIDEYTIDMECTNDDDKIENFRELQYHSNEA